MKSAAPAGYLLDAAGAHEFLSERAAALEQAGFGVFLPSWWSRKGTKLRLEARAVVSSPKLKSKSTLSLDSILEFHWEVSLGDETLTLDELRALAALKSPLVNVRGKWVELNPEEIKAALEFWTKKSETPITAREAVKMALGAANPPGTLEFSRSAQRLGLAPRHCWPGSKGASGVRGPRPASRLSGHPSTLPNPRFFLARLLAALGLRRLPGRRHGPGQDDPDARVNSARLGVAPGPRSQAHAPDLPNVGRRQLAQRGRPLHARAACDGASRRRSMPRGARLQERAARHALVLSSYSLLHRELDLLKQVSWASLILDEAQNIKNPQTKQAQAARALSVEHRVALTGTPAENHVGDLWSIIEFLNPGWLGTQGEFKRAFHVPIQTGRDPDAAGRLKRLTGPFILRRLKTDKAIIADLSRQMEMKVFCTLTKEQGSLYEAVVNDTTKEIEKLEGIKRKGIVLATLTKLKQVCNHPSLFLHDKSAVAGRSGKLARLTEMLEEALSSGDRALIFSQYAEMGGMLKKHLQETFGREVLFLHGATSKQQRDRMVERFQADDEKARRCFILSLKAGGTGLNLTAASHVFHFDRWWNPAVENQATDRAFRIGQTQRVQVHEFIAPARSKKKSMR